MYDASNRKDIRAAEKAAIQAELARITYLQAAMSVQAGRAWFYDLLEFCHLFNDPFTGNSLTEAYRKGERNVGLRLFADIIAHCPDDYIRMMKEANGRRIDNDSAGNRTAGQLDGSTYDGRDLEGSGDPDNSNGD